MVNKTQNDLTAQGHGYPFPVITALVLLLKAAPHNSGTSIAQSEITPDEAKSAGNPLWIDEHFCKIWRNLCK